MRSPVLRAVLVLHRYLGVVVGVLMTIWCLSGFVMMYQGFPALTEAERLGGLEPLAAADCCALEALPFADGQVVGDFRVEMLDGEPVLRFARPPRPGQAAVVAAPHGLYSLRTGEALGERSVAVVRAVGERQAAAFGVVGVATVERLDGVDQWTLQAGRHVPVYRVGFDDAGRQAVYVSAASGEAIQDTSRRERILSWFGAIPHWLYPKALRQNAALWTQVVIWTSVAGVFLTATGLYVGVARFGRRRNGRWSPFRGLWYWHHMIGMVFGLVTLTWVFSGLMTMGPWGLLEGPPSTLRRDIAGEMTWGEVRGLLGGILRDGALEADVVQLRGAALGGRPNVLAVSASGRRTRLDAEARATGFDDAEARRILARAGVKASYVLERIDQPDAYLYGTRREPMRPAWRAHLGDEQATRIYFDAATGEVARVVDRAGRQSRWLRNGLHSLDFIRGRPLWDGVVILLLLGVTAVCGAGAWMSLRRVRRDWTDWRLRQRRRAVSNRSG